MSIFSRLISASTLATLALGSTAAVAQSFPEKAITVIVPYTAGGTADGIGRALGQGLSEELGVSVVVDNKPGAGASLGTDFVAKSAPDGHTALLVSTAALTIYPSIYKANYDPQKDLVPLRSVAIAPVALAATEILKAEDFKTLLAEAKANPESVRFGTPGIGTNAHLGMELLGRMTETQMLHIPYKGNSQAITDALGGSFELLVTNADVVLPHAEKGTLRPLAVMAPARLSNWPDVPTLAEMGYTDAQYYSDFGFFVPAGTPQATVDRLQAALDKVTSSTSYKDFLASAKMQEGAGVGLDYADKIKAQTATNADVIRQANIKPN